MRSTVKAETYTCLFYIKKRERFYWKVPRLGQKSNADLTYSILATISYKTVSLGTHTVIPSFSPCFRSTMKVIFLNALEYCL
jgi:hypothetical protein